MAERGLLDVLNDMAGSGENHPTEYESPLGILATILNESPEKAAKRKAELKEFQERQEALGKTLARQARRQSIKALSALPMPTPSPGLFGSHIPPYSRPPTASKAFRARVRQNEHHERALIAYALDHSINLSSPDWRTQTLERLARSHPEIRPKRRRGRPRKEKKSGGILSAFLDDMGAPEDTVCLPQPYGDTPVSEVLTMTDEHRRKMAAYLKERHPELPHRRRDSDKMAAFSICFAEYPHLLEGDDHRGFHSKWQHWRNVISKARGKISEIKENSA